MNNLDELAKELTVLIAKRAVSGMYDFNHGYALCVEFLRSYGDERAREMRERAVSLASKRASDWSNIKDQDPDPRWTAKWQEAADLMALISDLPDS